jgi:hypothetical protein
MQELQRLRGKYKAFVGHRSVAEMVVTLAKALVVLAPRGRLLNYQVCIILFVTLPLEGPQNTAPRKCVSGINLNRQRLSVHWIPS